MLYCIPSITAADGRGRCSRDDKTNDKTKVIIYYEW